MDGSIASAVVLPDEPLPPASPPNGHKRRQSSVYEDSAKRPRFDKDDVANKHQDSTSEAKPAAPKRREGGRERRLFGAVLGALSQNPSTTAAQKRRFDIEKRQVAQRKQQDEEGEQRKAERVARRKEQRWKEQKRFERDSMRLRHDSLLNMAHFLRTETIPYLYYKPWETTAEEEECIQDQIAEAHDTIKREVEEYEARQKEEADRERRASRDADGSRDAEVSHIGKEHTADTPHQPSTTDGNANDSHNSPKDHDMDDDHAQDPGHEAVRVEGATEDALASNVPGHGTDADEASKDVADENGEDVIEEAAEDTVIY